MTRHAFVIGWPIAHSRSPLIHRHWLDRFAIDGTYDKVAVAPSDLADFIEAMPARGYVGGNVTVPHKEAVARLCSRLTPAASRTMSVNTVWFEDGDLWGDTTDGAGFVGALDEEAPGWAERRSSAVVLGAGGAARAVVDALLMRGFETIIVAGRTPARREALAQEAGCRAVPIDEVGALLPWADLLVNTTPAGMAGEAPLALDLAGLPSHATVDDIVYVPRDTPLLRAARARGLRTVGGLGMLLHQAVPGFERWFGVTPHVTPTLRALVEADLPPARSD